MQTSLDKCNSSFSKFIGAINNNDHYPRITMLTRELNHYLFRGKTQVRGGEDDRLYKSSVVHYLRPEAERCGWPPAAVQIDRNPKAERAEN